MTDAAEAARLFETHEPRPLAHIALGHDPIAALARANAALGLALSADEIAYLAAVFARLGRDPTDVEVMMFAQANSEHCRHKIFNADWVVDGAAAPRSLFASIRHTRDRSPQGVLSAYSDNAAVLAGSQGARFFPEGSGHAYGWHEEPVDILIKVETHNHPTAISPFAGAATGSGGEIRDEGATGRGAKPKAGLVGFTVSNLRIPGFEQPWETDHGRPARIASALEIMQDGPIGAAAFNNEFGRPGILGYFRSFEQRLAADPAGVVRGYHKPIMIAGGLGNVRRMHVEKQAVPAGAPLVLLGGPAMLIGLGGGAASSQGSGTASEQLDFASVQRGNPEMQRRAQQVIDACWAMGERQPDPDDPRRRRRRPVERGAGSGGGRQRRRAHRACRGAERRARHVAARDLVQRGAGALRAGARARAARRLHRPVPPRALSLRGHRARDRRRHAGRRRIRARAAARSRCRSPTCSDGRRGCGATCAGARGAATGSMRPRSMSPPRWNGCCACRRSPTRASW